MQKMSSWASCKDLRNDLKTLFKMEDICEIKFVPHSCHYAWTCFNQLLTIIRVKTASIWQRGEYSHWATATGLGWELLRLCERPDSDNLNNEVRVINNKVHINHNCCWAEKSVLKSILQAQTSLRVWLQWLESIQAHRNKTIRITSDKLDWESSL